MINEKEFIGRFLVPPEDIFYRFLVLSVLVHYHGEMPHTFLIRSNASRVEHPNDGGEGQILLQNV